MSRKKRFLLSLEKAAIGFLRHILEEKPWIPFFIPLILIALAIERWLVSFANLIPLAFAVWATRQYGSYQCKLLVDDMNNKWKRVVLNTLPITPLEHCEWLNRLLTEVWSNYFNPKLSIKLSSIVELKVRLVVKEWQFSDGTHSLNNFRVNSQQVNGSSHLLSRTGRKLHVTVLEGRNLAAKEKSGKFEPYIKLQYGKIFQRTRTSYTSNPIWNHKFVFDEIGGAEYLKLKCFSEETFGDENIGIAHVNLEGLVERRVRDVWVPLERVGSGELRLEIEAVTVDDQEESWGSALGSGNGLIELDLVEARDLIAADLRGTSDPYVRVNYGNLKKKTKVLRKTLNPQWNQTLEFPDDGSPLVLLVKDHNSLLPTSSIGECVVEYQRLPPNQMADKWIPLQGVKRGEIHIRITRKVPELQKRRSLDFEPSLSKLHQIPIQIKQMIIKFRSLIEDGNLEELSTSLSELETLEDTQKGYIVQLETEQKLLLSKIRELGTEMINSSPALSRRASSTR